MCVNVVKLVVHRVNVIEFCGGHHCNSRVSDNVLIFFEIIKIRNRLFKMIALNCRAEVAEVDRAKV